MKWIFEVSYKSAAYGGEAPAALAARTSASVPAISVETVAAVSLYTLSVNIIFISNMDTHSHWKVGTLATSAAWEALAAERVGMADAEISDA